MRLALFLLALFLLPLLAACEAPQPTSNAPVRIAESPCSSRMFEGSRFTVCPAKGARIEVFTAAASGVPFRSFARLQPALGERATEYTALIGELIGFEYHDDPHIAPILGEAKQIRDRAFHALASYFQSLQRDSGTPVVLLLDDLHWADEASLRGLEFLAPELRSTALLVVATFRDVEVRRDHPLSKLLGALAREPAKVISAQGVGGMNANADDVTRINTPQVEGLQRFIDDRRRTVLRRRRRREHIQPARRDHGRAKGNVRRVDDVYAH